VFLISHFSHTNCSGFRRAGSWQGIKVRGVSSEWNCSRSHGCVKVAHRCVSPVWSATELTRVIIWSDAVWSWWRGKVIYLGNFSHACQLWTTFVCIGNYLRLWLDGNDVYISIYRLLWDTMVSSLTFDRKWDIFSTEIPTHLLTQNHVLCKIERWYSLGQNLPNKGMFY